MGATVNEDMLAIDVYRHAQAMRQPITLGPSRILPVLRVGA